MVIRWGEEINVRHAIYTQPRNKETRLGTYAANPIGMERRRRLNGLTDDMAVARSTLQWQTRGVGAAAGRPAA
jgi:hypothetical protein